MIGEVQLLAKIGEGRFEILKKKTLELLSIN